MFPSQQQHQAKLLRGKQAELAKTSLQKCCTKVLAEQLHVQAQAQQQTAHPAAAASLLLTTLAAAGMLLTASGEAQTLLLRRTLPRVMVTIGMHWGRA